MKNIFTVDTEDWFHANYEGTSFPDTFNARYTVEKNVDSYLGHFDRYGCKATFFVLGSVAEQFPQMVRKIAESGHEIASHGYSHLLVYRQSPDEFREDVRKSRHLLEDISGSRVIGYRAPSWSITRESLWALDILIQEGFEYDSSIFPTRNYLYGIPDAPRFANRPIVNGEEVKILEIPPSTFRAAGLNIPFSGGFYFRALPFFLIDRFTSAVNSVGHPAVFYLHPREIDPDQPRLQLSLRDGFVHYYGVEGCEKKLLRLLEKYKTASIAEEFFSLLQT